MCAARWHICACAHAWVWDQEKGAVFINPTEYSGPCNDKNLILHSAVLLFSQLKSCLTFCDPMDCSAPGFPVLHYLPEFAQVHVQLVGDTI